MEPRVASPIAGRLIAGYAEYPPPADLAPYVAAFWSRFSPDELPSNHVHRVLPDGCVDIVLAFSDSGDAVPLAPAQAIGVGPMTKPMFMRGGGPRLYLGVRFKPGCAFVALGIPASDLIDVQMMFDELSADPSRDLAAIIAATSDRARLVAMIDLVRHRLCTPRAVPKSVRAAVRAIVGANGDLKIALLAADIGVTRQQLARQFATHVGVTPKMLARVMRAQAALARADAARAAHPHALDWAAIAYELGYYDQPHFIDDFKALTGSTPSEWVTPSFAGKPTP
ncbi:MAG: helix-turn-helix domain-containing protein [Gemmatimonadaceae bacterium]